MGHIIRSNSERKDSSISIVIDRTFIEQFAVVNFVKISSANFKAIKLL